MILICLKPGDPIKNLRTKRSVTSYRPAVPCFLGKRSGLIVRDTSFRDTSTMRRIILGTHDPQNFVRDTSVEDTSYWQHAQESLGLAYSHPHQNADLIQTQVTGVLASVRDIGEKFKRVSVTVPTRDTRGGWPLLTVETTEYSQSDNGHFVAYIPS
jgi:hypothetical protein